MAKSRTTVETTERSGPARLVFGCLFIALGLLWLMGITFRDATQFNLLRLFRDNAHGLCGVLNSLLPIFSIFGGTMLAISSRHPVRSRFFWIPAAMFVLLCGILTLTARVSTTGLVDYVRVTIGREMRMMNPDSLPACLIGAYNVRSFNNGMLAGGGLLGMAVAYPLYTILNTATGIAVLIIAEIALFLWLIRFDVSAALALISKTVANAAARRKERLRPEPEAVEEAEPEPMTDVEPPRVFIPTQQVRFTTTVGSDPIAEYLVPEADPQSYREQIIEQQNMFSARQEIPFEPVISIEKPDPQPRAQEETVFEPLIAVTDMPAREEVQQPVETTEPQPAAESDSLPVVEAVPEQSVEQPVEPPQRRRRSSRGKETPPTEPIVRPIITRAVQEEEPVPAIQKPVFRQEQPVITEVLPQDDAEPRRRRSAVADLPSEEPAAPLASPEMPEAEDLPWEEEPVRPARPARRSEPVRTTTVHTDAAVSLDGHRTSIPQNSPFAKLVKEEEEDALARKHTRAPMVQPSADYCRPPMNLLKMGQAAQEDTHVEDEERARLLEQTLDSFSISAHVVKTEHGPAITRFAIELGKGVNVNKLNGISNNLALAMKANGLRIEVPIPGTSYVGIEVPNSKRQMVTLREVLDSPEMRAQTSPTVVAMGKDITGKPVLCDLKKMPHLLIAGATGSGKSVCINTIVQSIMYRATPKQVRLMMVDPKVVELQPYNGIPHLLTPVITDPKKAAAALDWALEEMRDRYNRFERVGVNRIDRYNAVITDDSDYMSEIVIIIDEFYDLMQQCRKNVEATIQSLASLARAAGIYMVIATQRPSVDVITGVIKANIPGRIAFAVSNNTDSRTIIDRIGAEKLLRQGDMLYMPSGNPNPMRVQGCYVSDEESEEIINFVRDYNDSVYDDRVDEHIANVLHEEEEEAAAKERSRSNRGRDSENWEDDYANDPVGENDLLQKAIALAVESGQTSISLLRRRFSLGHSKAGKLIDTMEQMGIISADEGPKPRRTLITREEWAKRQGEILDE